MLSSNNNQNPPPFAPVRVANEVVPVSAPSKLDFAVKTEYNRGHADTAPSQSTRLNESQLQKLMKQGFTRGLAQSLNQVKDAFALRIWVVDNSGSMNTRDGHKIVDNKSKNVRTVSCTRWEEIRECVNYHIRLAGGIGAPTKFRLLNNQSGSPDEFGVSEAPGMFPHDVDEALSVMAMTSPTGCTPLTRHVLHVRNLVSQMAPQLRSAGQRVVIVIATDGLPSDDRGYSTDDRRREFVDSLRSLEGLPVWIVVRLCTDEDNVVEFYNDLDAILEVSVEVLDDFNGEAEEVYQTNPWLNYALPLHRLREMGFHDRVFDMLDERLLTRSELRDFCALLFGEEYFDGVPDPSLDWKGFASEIERLLAKEKMQWNPKKKRATPWINMKKLNRLYAPSNCVIQ